MTSQLKKLIRDRRGATAIEYGLIAALIALVMAVGAASLGNSLSNKFTAIGTSITSP